MASRTPLWDLLLARRSSATSSEPLESELAAVLAQAEHEWGPLGLSQDDFVRYLGERLPAERSIAEGLATLHGPDLYLACACAFGSRPALALFERHFIPTIDPHLAKVDRSPSFVDEARQRVRERLLVGVDGRPPKIAQYTGQGALRAWLRVSAVRTALTMVRRRKPDAEASAGGLELQPAAGDVELELLRRRHARDLEAAFAGALASLSVDDRNIMRLHYLDGLTIEQIARTYGMSRAGAGRALLRIRAVLLDEAKRLLGERLRLPPTELDSALALLRSHMQVSLRSLLR